MRELGISSSSESDSDQSIGLADKHRFENKIYVEQIVMFFCKKEGPIIFSFFSDMVSAAAAWTTCATASAETSFETAPEAFRHEPVDDRVQTAEIVIKISLFLCFFIGN